MESFSKDIHTILQELKESEQQAGELISVVELICDFNRVNSGKKNSWRKTISSSDQRSFWQFLLLRFLLHSIDIQVCWHQFQTVL